MTQKVNATIQPGMKVFAGSDEIGKVTAVREDDFEVSRGTIFRHVYAIPSEYVDEANDGVIDLSIDRAFVDGLEVAASDGADLPEEYRRLEMDGGDRGSGRDDPPDLQLPR
jgi:hypothetical protein